MIQLIEKTQPDETCRRCNAAEGEEHEEGCVAAVCSFCRKTVHPCPHHGVTNPKWLHYCYLCKLTKDSCGCDRHAKDPYYDLTLMCHRCGERHIDYFMADNWQKVPLIYRDKILCVPCYQLFCKGEELCPISK